MNGARLSTWLFWVLGFVVLYSMVPGKGRIPLLAVLLIGGLVWLDRPGGPGIGATIALLKGEKVSEA